MTYFAYADLQKIVYDALIQSTSLADLVGEHIYDAVPSATVASTYLLIGEETTTVKYDSTASVMRQDIIISVLSTSHGFSDAKVIAAETCRALENAHLILPDDSLRQFKFRTARARRDTNVAERRIDLTFRALIDA